MTNPIDDEQRALLNAIRASWDEDLPRLVYADWLEERGEVLLAELIRVQCELAHWIPNLQRRQHLRRQELTLSRKLTVSSGPASARSVQFRRGRTWVWASTETWRRSRKWLHHVDSFRPSSHDQIGPMLARITHFAHLARLDLRGQRLTDQAFLPLLNIPQLVGIRELDLRHNLLSRSAIARLADSPLGRGLLRCRVYGNQEPCDSLGWPALQEPPGIVCNSVGMSFAPIPAGTFLMGSPHHEVGRFTDESQPQEVTLSKPFYFGVYEVTHADYERLSPDGNSPGGAWHPELTRYHPVENVAYEEALRFCERLSDLPEERRAGRRYRLPTEAEWEHACRAGTFTPFHFGSHLDARIANMGYGGIELPGGILARMMTTPVGWYDPNDFGLYDMHGNVWEWCSDWYASRATRRKLQPVTDPQGPNFGIRRVLRGGSWSYSARYCRSACRAYNLDTLGNNHVGFRVVMEQTTPLT